MRTASSAHAMHDGVKFPDDDDDVAVDFSNAVLYVGALQTITATVFTAAVSIISCVAFPYNFVSAIRTLVLSSIVGIAVLRKPFRLGRVHGLNLIFRALQPCVLIYICSEVAEQLVHTCTRETSTPSWRRFVFHSMSAVMIISGFLRARRPLAQTDLPFLLTSTALLIISMLPPPAVVLSGPLCSSPTLSSAAERLLRSFVFALLYSVFVYAAAPPAASSSEMMICVMRASAASIWVLAAHSYFLPFAIVQCSIVIYTRIFGNENSADEEKTALMTPSSEYYSQYGDFEGGGGGGGNGSGYAMKVASAAEAAEAAADAAAAAAASASAIDAAAAEGAEFNGMGCCCSSCETDSMIVPSFNALGARGLVDISSSSGGGGGGGISVHKSFPINGMRPRSGVVLSDYEIAAVAARLEAQGLATGSEVPI